MRTALDRLSFDDHHPGYQQVATKVRELILTGVLATGEKLPSSETLVQRWGLNQRTIHRGMVALVKEGLLDRRPRLGTFVRARTQRLTHVGIYYSENIWPHGGSQFLQALQGALKAELAEINVETDVWVDPRPTKAESEPWSPFVTAAQQRDFQAVIVPTTDPAHMTWQYKLPVPVAFLSTANLPNCVSTDLVGFFKLALRELKRQGCRTVGMVPAFDPGLKLPDGSPTQAAVAMAAFVELAGAAGLTLRNNWLHIPPQPITSTAAAHRFGHAALTALWRQPHRPDGLIVTDDVAATGVFAALLELGVKVPAELKLAVHKNSAVDIFTPLPATFIELSTPAIAAALIKQVQQQFRGEPVTPLSIGFHVAKPAALP